MALSEQRLIALVKAGYKGPEIMELTGASRSEVEHLRRKARNKGLIKRDSEKSAPRKEAIYQAIVRAAEAGLPCPTNSELAVTAGFDSKGGAVVAVAALEKEGRIKVKRSRMARVVTITATGKTTADAKEDQKAEVAEMVANGLSQPQIARRLGLSVGRVAQIWTSIKRDLGWQAQ